MGDQSAIEWTDATWNPLIGCRRVSEGCRHCYAEGMAARIANAAQARLRDGGRLTPTQEAYRRVVRWEQGGKDAADANDKALPQWNGRVVLIPDALDQPLRWKKPRRIFVNSMSDLFHESVPDAWIDRVFAVMALSPHHTFQVLTKRPERMQKCLTDTSLARCDGRGEAVHSFDPTFPLESISWPLPNVWLGVSVEDQATANARIPHLLQTPAAVRWISAEPLLGKVDLTSIQFVGRSGLNEEWNALYDYELDGDGPGPTLDWVVVGGESGPGARPMHPNWVRSIRDQCVGAGVAFNFKQWGVWAPNCLCEGKPCCRTTPRPQPGPPGVMFACGKHRAGRLLDERWWDEYPQGAHHE